MRRREGRVRCWANLTVAFLLELCALAAVLWGCSQRPVPPVSLPPVKFAVQLLVFGSAALALSTTGHRHLPPPSPPWWSPTPSWCAFDK